MEEHPWINILHYQPLQGQRVLVKLLGGQVRITTYDRFSFEQWCISAWKAMPDAGSTQQKVTQ